MSVNKQYNELLAMYEALGQYLMADRILEDAAKILIKLSNLLNSFKKQAKTFDCISLAYLQIPKFSVELHLFSIVLHDYLIQ